MSKRHQASRRRAYGRRQHELHERETRHAERSFAGAFDPTSWRYADESLAAREVEIGPNFRFAMGD